jgi:hypothetical protein
MCFLFWLHGSSIFVTGAAHAHQKDEEACTQNHSFWLHFFGFMFKFNPLDGYITTRGSALFRGRIPFCIILLQTQHCMFSLHH